MPDHRYPPQDAYLNVLTWLRDDIYPGLVGHPLDDRGIAAWLCDRFPRLYQTNDVENAKHRLYEEIARVVNPPARPPSGRAPIQGQLRVVNDSFSDDTGPRVVSMCHAGNLFLEYVQDRDKALRALDVIAAAGYHGIRVWTRLRGEWWRMRSGEVGHEITSGWEAYLAAFLSQIGDRKLVAHVAAGDLAHLDDTGRVNYFNDLGWLCRTFGPTVALAEWANESRDTAGGLTPQDAWNDMRPIREQAPCLTALTAYTGHEDEELFRLWTPDTQQFRLVHALRSGHWWDKLRHIFSLPYETGTRYWHGEPWGVGWRVSAIEHQHELDARVMRLAALQCGITGGVWTYFSSPGVILGDERFEDQPGFAETPVALAALDTLGKQYELEWGRARLIHGNPNRDNVFKLLGHDETARIDQAIFESQGVCVATKYSSTWDVSYRVAAGWQEVEHGLGEDMLVAVRS